MKIDLTGVHVLITGAGRGIGRAIAQETIAASARTAVHYHRTRGPAEELVRDAGNGSAAFAADLSQTDACKDLFDAVVTQFGHVDVLINNAGIAPSAPIEQELGAWCENFQQTLTVNLLAAGILCREAVVHFRGRGGGRIINIASRAAFRGDGPDHWAYAASKGGMVAMSRTIARAYGKDGITSFVIAPGWTRTDMAEKFIKAHGEDAVKAEQALDRITEPSDIAPLAVLLASGLADHATGSTIDVNAGSYVH